jgi:hypothetical protein
MQGDFPDMWTMAIAVAMPAPIPLKAWSDRTFNWTASSFVTLQSI